jgi:hypothetical protein
VPRPRICDEPRVVTAVRLPASLRHELDRAAAERAVSVNFLVTRAVTDYLRSLPPLDQVGAPVVAVDDAGAER